MTTHTHSIIHTDHAATPDFRFTKWDSFSVLEVKAGHATVSIHLSKDTTIADLIGALAKIMEERA